MILKENNLQGKFQDPFEDYDNYKFIKYDRMTQSYW